MIPKLLICNVVYGDEYTKTFLYTLPSILVNFQYLKKNNYSAKLLIYTTENDRKTIFAFELFKEINSLINVEIINIDNFFRGQIHATMTACHNDVIKKANKENAAMVFLAPDIILSNNVFEKIYTSLAQNKRLLVAPAIRLKKETFIDNVNSRDLFNIKPRELVKKAIPHFHQLTYDTFWDYSKKIYCWPAIIGWHLDKENILIRGFHLHPLFIWPEKKTNLCKLAIDQDFVNTVYNKNNCEVLSNSDEAVLFELTTIKRINMGTYHENKFKLINDFVKTYLLDCHILFSKTKIYILSSDYKKSKKWKKKEKESDKVINLTTKIFNNDFYRKVFWKIFQFFGSRTNYT